MRETATPGAEVPVREASVLDSQVLFQGAEVAVSDRCRGCAIKRHWGLARVGWDGGSGGEGRAEEQREGRSTARSSSSRGEEQREEQQQPPRHAPLLPASSLLLPSPPSFPPSFFQP